MKNSVVSWSTRLRGIKIEIVSRVSRKILEAVLSDTSQRKRAGDAPARRFEFENSERSDRRSTVQRRFARMTEAHDRIRLKELAKRLRSTRL